MKRLALRLAGAAALISITACNPLGGGGGSLSDASKAAVAAQAKFETLAAGSSQAGGHAPGFSDPAAGPALRTLFDTHALPATPPPFDDIDPLQNWLLALAKTGQIFLLSGTGATDLSSVASDPAAQTKVGENLIAYAPEVGGYIDAMNAVSRLEVASMSAQLASHPDTAGMPGIDKVRAGVAQTIGGELSSMAAPGLTDEWRRARMPGLVSLTQAATPLLTVEQKARLAAGAREVRVEIQDPVVRSQLEGIAVSFGG